MNTDSCGRLGRVQITASGVQSNIMIIGISLILYYLHPSSLCIIAIIINTVLTIMNMGFSSSSLDGYSIVTELLGIKEEVMSFIKEALKKCNKRKILSELKNCNAVDKVTLFNGVIILGCRIFPTLLLILNVLLLIGI